MKFTVNIPVGEIAPGEFQTVAAIKTMASTLEDSRVDACYVTDHPAPSAAWLHANGHDALDPFTALAFVAAFSSNLKLHTNILVLPYRNPFLTAKAAASLQVLSGGRLILGTGAGYQTGEFEALGVDFHKRGALFNEALEVIRLAWAGGAVVKQGMHFNAAGNEPRPIPPTSPPIWIGGGSGKAVERAARWGDGWCPFFAAPTMSKSNQESGIHSVEQLRENIVQLHEMRKSQGKVGDFDIAIGAREKLEYGSAESASQYLKGISALAAVGVNWIMVDPPHPDRQTYLENVRWFGKAVISQL